MVKVYLEKLRERTGSRYVKSDVEDVDTFLDETLGLNGSVWPAIRRDLHETFDYPVNEVVKLDGIGSGKSTYVVLSLAYVLRLLGSVTDAAKIYGQMPGDKIGIVISSLRERQAKNIIFDRLKTRLDRSRWFRTHYRYEEKGGMEIEFPNGVFVLSGSSSESVPIGYNVLVGALDEGDWFLKQSHIGDALDQAENVFTSLKDRIETRFENRGLTLLVTSARQVDGFMLSRYEAVRGARYGFTTRRPYWEAKPGRWAPYFRVRLSDLKVIERNVARYRSPTKDWILIPMRLEDEFKRNPRLFLRNRASVILTGSNAYVLRPDLIRFNTERRNIPIQDGILPDNFKPQPGAIYYAHNDLGFSQDKAVVSLGHQEGQITVIDFIYVIDPKVEGRVNFGWVRRIFYQLLERGFAIGLVTFDRFNSLETMQKLEDRGISVELFSVDTNRAAYDCWLEAHYEGTLDVPYVEGYMVEAKGLIERGNKIVHPSNKSKDITDSVAGTTYHCREQGGVVGAAVVREKRGDKGERAERRSA